MNGIAKPAPAFHLFWLLSYISIASVSAAIITPALPVIQIHFGISFDTVEWLVSAFLIGYVLGQLVYGPLANRFGRLQSLRIGLVINIVGIVLCIFSVSFGTYWLLIIGRLITALGAASGLACTVMLINEWLPESQRNTAMSYAIISFAFGMGSSVVLGGLITQYIHWEFCFYFLLFHGIIMLYGTRLFSETLLVPKSIRLRTVLHDYASALTSAKLLVFSAVMGSCTAVSYCFSAVGPQIAHQRFMLSAAEYGYWNTINIMGMLAGGLLGKELLGRLSLSQVLTVGLVGVGIGVSNLYLIWIFESDSVVWFFISTSSLFLFSSFLYAGGSLIASNALEDKASAASMMSFCNMFFATICLILMSYLARIPLVSFILILSLIWILVFACLSLNWEIQ